MNKKIRIFALLIALTVGFVMLFSAVFLVVEAHHDCTGKHCPTCYQMEVCESVLKTLTNVVPMVVAITVLIQYFLLSTSAFNISKQEESLVTLKVKLSN